MPIKERDRGLIKQVKRRRPSILRHVKDQGTRNVILHLVRVREILRWQNGVKR